MAECTGDTEAEDAGVVVSVGSFGVVHAAKSGRPLPGSSLTEVALSGTGRGSRPPCRDLLREIAQSLEMVIYTGAINRDHVHMLTGIPPNISVSWAVEYLRGKISHRLLCEYARLRRLYWGQHLRTRGYWVATSGNVTDEVWKRYIDEQKPPSPDDDFNVA